ncbi:MAG TPA: GNAT family N-acetyltransferase [Steroidobacteraceae bacterium]|nr:GNAT family N-acetyltransferase [Steroidobacteraceae bacterium]
MDAATHETRSHSGIESIAAADWNALDSGGVPFLRHEFFATLERSGAVAPATGWQAAHVTVRSAGALVGALPLYEKTHSWGEFVFDFSWAEAYRRYGARYYPKLVAATPFTPATGPRLLVRPGADVARVRRALLEGALGRLGACSSLHVQFTTRDEGDWLTAQGLLARVDCQFQWQNEGYRDFEDFLATFTAEKRKKAHRERRRIREAGIEFEWRSGEQLSGAEWRAVYALKAATFHRHGHEPYVPLACFTELSRSAACRPLVLLATKDRALVACAIFFRGADTLYGRYWGADGEHHSLHFEACYYQGIEYCIREGLRRFEPGTQGEHKIARGFRPTLTYSAHAIGDPRFRAAIERYLGEERAAIEAYAAETARHVPFKAECPPIELPPETP